MINIEERVYQGLIISEGELVFIVAGNMRADRQT